MKKLNDYVYIKDESLIYPCGKYRIPKDLPAGEYYIWGKDIYYEYIRQTNRYICDNDFEGYAVFEKKDKISLERGMMTPIENIGYVNEKVDRLYPDHVYRSELEVPLGFYLYKFDEKYFVEEESFLERNECGIDLYKANSDSRRTREKGEYGCVEITSEWKHIVVLNGFALYYGQSKFDEVQILENEKITANQFYDKGESLVSNEVIDMRLFFRYHKGGRFCGKITVDLKEYDWYVINGKCKWRAKVIPFSGQALSRLVIKFSTTDGIEEVQTISGFQNIRYTYNDKTYRGCYIIHAELPEKFFGHELQLTLLEYNEFAINEPLMDYQNAENYMDELELRKYYKEDFEQLKRVLDEIEGINTERELECFDKMPDMIHLILPTLEEIARAKHNFVCVKENINEEITFVIKATYNKAFYCIAKLADQAKDVYSQDNGNEFVITYDSKQKECIKMIYYILEHESFGYLDEPIRNFLQKNCCEYYVMQKANECISKLCQEYGYNGLYRNFTLRRIINNENRKIRSEVDKIYSDVVKENRVPTRWGNEYRLFSLISNQNSNAQYQYHCEWLGQQSLDIYIPESRIGIEYQGEQHYKAVEIWGGEAALKENQERDLRKKKLCSENGVVLLEWSYQVPVNGENVMRFMKENGIPFVGSEREIQIRTEMAPIIETKKKIEKKKTKLKSIKHYIVQYDLDGNYVNKYGDVGSAAGAVGVSTTSISKVLRGQRNSAAGFVWRKVDADEKIVEHIELDIEKACLENQILASRQGYSDGKARRVAQISGEGEVIVVYNSIAEAVRLTGVNSKSIRDAAAGKQKHAGGFKWKYQD